MNPRKPLLYLAVGAVLFWVLYSWLYAGNQGIYHSPDEQAVAVFAEHFVSEGTLRIPHEGLPEIVFPRSVTVVGDAYVPGSFIGLPVLLGYVGKLFGPWAMNIFVPGLAAFAPLALFLVLRPLWGQHIAWRSACLLWVWPAWSYYASRSYLPNIGFVSCLILAAGGVSIAMNSHNMTKQKRMASMLIAGLFWGLALAIRPVEAIWVIPTTLVLLWWCRIPWGSVLSFGCMAALPLAVLALWQARTYGAWYMTGYGLPPSAGQRAVSQQVAHSIWLSVFPFGAHPWEAIQRWMQYALMVYWWQLPFLVFGIARLIKLASKTPAYKKYTLILSGVSAYLLVYYGSWPISDHPDPNWISLGVAHNRYWLPLAVLLLPVLALGVQGLVERFPQRSWLPPLVWSWLAAWCVFSAFATGADSLWALRQNGVKYAYARDQISAHLPENALIVTDREDKWLWPRFHVIRQTAPDFTYMPNLQSIVESGAPLFWLTDLPTSHVQDMEQRIFARYALGVVPKTVSDGYRLYQFVSLPNEHETRL